MSHEQITNKMNTDDSSVDNIKKRRTDSGGGPTRVGHDREDDLALGRELGVIKSAINDMLDHNCSQMASMQEEMKHMHGEVKNLQDDVKYVREKCDTMEKSTQKKKNFTRR